MIRSWWKCGVLGSCLYSARLFLHLLLFGNPQAQLPLVLSPPGLGVSLWLGALLRLCSLWSVCYFGSWMVFLGAGTKLLLPPLISARYSAALSWWESRRKTLGQPHTSDKNSPQLHPRQCATLGGLDKVTLLPDSWAQDCPGSS